MEFVAYAILTVIVCILFKNLLSFRTDNELAFKIMADKINHLSHSVFQFQRALTTDKCKTAEMIKIEVMTHKLDPKTKFIMIENGLIKLPISKEEIEKMRLDDPRLNPDSDVYIHPRNIYVPPHGGSKADTDVPDSLAPGRESQNFTPKSSVPPLPDNFLPTIHGHFNCKGDYVMHSPRPSITEILHDEYEKETK